MDELREGNYYYKEGNLHYIIKGKGDPLLFFHGYGMSPWSFSPIIDTLSKKYKVVVPNLSKGWKFYAAKDNIFDSLVNIAQKLLEDLHIQNTNVVGYSMGGLIALKMANRYPLQVGCLIIIDGYAPDKCHSLIQLAVRIIYEVIKNVFTRNGFIPMIKVILDYWKNAIFHLYSVITITSSCLKTIIRESINYKGRTLILWGKNDSVITCDFATRLNNNLPQSKLELLEGKDHVWGLTYPELLLEKVDAFIKVDY